MTLGCVYFIKIENRNLFKVGKTKGKAEQRLNQLQIGSPDNLILFGTIATNDPIALERKLHQQLKEYHCRGEWYQMSHETAEAIMTHYKGFRLWLKQFESNDDPYGDFARDTKYAFETEIYPVDANRDKNTFCSWIYILDGERACREAKATFLELWGMYRKSVKP